MGEYIELLKPKGHTIFSGALDKSDLNLLERTGIRAVHAPYGDYRPWDEINAWTDEIANELQHLPTAV